MSRSRSYYVGLQVYSLLPEQATTLIFQAAKRQVSFITSFSQETKKRWEERTNKHYSDNMLGLNCALITDFVLNWRNPERFDLTCRDEVHYNLIKTKTSIANRVLLHIY